VFEKLYCVLNKKRFENVLDGLGRGKKKKKKHQVKGKRKFEQMKEKKIN
jgi:hypothetical protein